jgi:hypothetical protein
MWVFDGWFLVKVVGAVISGVMLASHVELGSAVGARGLRVGAWCLAGSALPQLARFFPYLDWLSTLEPLMLAAFFASLAFAAWRLLEAAGPKETP